jgi:hypothetical protein
MFRFFVFVVALSLIPAVSSGIAGVDKWMERHFK